uniref:Uncharacterized protein n=1 Tax=Sphaerodactylus townsendi TaxID=933632 RepID=A0ACB8ETI0_9SAUR
MRIPALALPAMTMFLTSEGTFKVCKEVEDPGEGFELELRCPTLCQCLIRKGYCEGRKDASHFVGSYSNLGGQLARKKK